MAFGGRKARGDIDVTPLVDVVLVLLIIFLVAVPVALRHLAVDVPRADPNPQRRPAREPVLVEVLRSGIDGSGHVISVTLDGRETHRTDLAERLHEKLAPGGVEVVFVDFDDATQYADAVAIIDVTKGAGATNVAIRTRQP